MPTCTTGLLILEMNLHNDGTMLVLLVLLALMLVLLALLALMKVAPEEVPQRQD